MSTARNLVNLSGVGKEYAARTILEDVTLGIAEDDRIGVVGGNGQGKSTLLGLVAGSEQPDSGQVTRLGGLRIGSVDQSDRLAGGETIRAVLVGERARARVGRRSRVPWRARRPARRRRAGALPERARHPDQRPLRRRAPPHRAGARAAGSPRPAVAGRAHQPPRRGGDRLARPPPRRARRRDADRHPRPLVPGRGLHPHLGGRRG